MPDPSKPVMRFCYACVQAATADSWHDDLCPNCGADAKTRVAALFTDLPAEQRYLHDTDFTALVDMLEIYLHLTWTPSELRDAALLAAIHYEASKAGGHKREEPGAHG